MICDTGANAGSENGSSRPPPELLPPAQPGVPGMERSGSESLSPSSSPDRLASAEANSLMPAAVARWRWGLTPAAAFSSWLISRSSSCG